MLSIFIAEHPLVFLALCFTAGLCLAVPLSIAIVRAIARAIER